MKDNKKIYLHIGLHKTGSTSIQAALIGYNKNNIKTISFKEENHSIPLYTIFSENRYNYHIWTSKGFSRDDIDKKKNEYEKILEKEIKNSQEKSLIISGEDLSALNSSEVHSLYNFFSKFNLSIEIICYVRNPIKFIVSDIQEVVKHGRDIPFYGSLYRERIIPYIEHFGEENFHLHIFDDVIKTHGSVVKHFASILSLNLDEPIRRNESLTALQFALILKLNQVPLNIFGNASHYKLRQDIVNAILKVTSRLEINYKIDYKHLTVFFPHDMKEQAKWIENKFNLMFNLPKYIENESMTSFHDFIDKTIDSTDTEIFKNIFKEINVNFEDNSDITTNFTKACFNLLSN